MRPMVIQEIANPVEMNPETRLQVKNFPKKTVNLGGCMEDGW